MQVETKSKIMETITIQVSPEIAQAYSNVSSEQQTKIQTFLDVMFNEKKHFYK